MKILFVEEEQQAPLIWIRMLLSSMT